MLTVELTASRTIQVAGLRTILVPIKTRRKQVYNAAEHGLQPTVTMDCLSIKTLTRLYNSGHDARKTRSRHGGSVCYLVMHAPYLPCNHNF